MKITDLNQRTVTGRSQDGFCRSSSRKHSKHSRAAFSCVTFFAARCAQDLLGDVTKTAGAGAWDIQGTLKQQPPGRVCGQQATLRLADAGLGAVQASVLLVNNRAVCRRFQSALDLARISIPLSTDLCADCTAPLRSVSCASRPSSI